jgi:two-component system NtrC family sensor kinase
VSAARAAVRTGIRKACAAASEYFDQPHLTLRARVKVVVISLARSVRCEARVVVKALNQPSCGRSPGRLTVLCSLTTRSARAGQGASGNSAFQFRGFPMTFMNEATTTLILPEGFGETGQHPSWDVGESEKQASDRRVLIVDDESAIRNLFATWLSEDYECETAASADEALAILAAETYALVISDMMMPGRNGVELLREIRSRYPETAVIMISGVDRPQRVRDALRVGASDYLIKPCELDGLTLSVERALEHRALQRTARSYKAHLENQNVELATSKTVLERLQAQLVHTEKMASLGQLSAGIAHELNNPAGFVYGNMDILQVYLADLARLLNAYDALALPPAAAVVINSLKTEISYEKLLGDLSSILSDCREGAQRICDVVKNLRLFSRLDEAELKRVDIHEGLDSTIRLLSRYYTDGRVSLHRDYGDLPEVNCYAGQLNQVWMNLLGNAAQAVPDQGVVNITTRSDGDWVTIAISDTGTGIAEDQLSRIFDPFFTTKSVGEGTGLGLSISYGIIERHGGTITVTSEVGSGSTFTVRIPTCAAGLEPAQN